MQAGITAGRLQIDLLLAESDGQASAVEDDLLHAQRMDIEIGDGLDIAAGHDEVVDAQDADHAQKDSL